MIIIAILLPLIIGFLIMNIILFKKENLLAFPEKLALSYMVGTILISLEMAVLVILRINFSAVVIALPWVLLLPAVLLTPRTININLKDKSQLNLLLLALIGLKTAYISFEALIKPVVGYDAIWNFSQRSKIFFFEKTIPLIKGAPNYLGNGMKQYPLHLPLLEAWTYLAMNSWDDLKMKIIFPLYFIALIIIFYYGLRQEKGKTHSLFFTFLLTTLPFLTYHATIEYADFIVGAYFLGAAVYLYRYFETNENRFLIISTFLAGSAGWVKDEGTIFYGIWFLTLLLFNKLKDLKALAIYSIPFFVFTLPWLTIKKILGLTLGNDPDFKLTNPASYLTPHLDIIPEFLRRTFLMDNWHLLGIAFIIFLVFYYKDIIKTNKKYLLAMFSFSFAFFAYVYLFTGNWYLIAVDIILSRNYLTYLPIGLFLMGLTFSFKSGPKSDGKVLKTRKRRS